MTTATAIATSTWDGHTIALIALHPEIQRARSMDDNEQGGGWINADITIDGSHPFR